MKIFTKKIIAVIFILTAFVSKSQITWTNGNGTGIWSDALNWSTSVAPTSADDVIFDGTSTANCTIDQDIQINNLTIAAAYTGIIDGTTGQSRIIQTNNFSQAGGTFISPDDTYNITGNMTLTGGTFNNNGGMVTVFINSGSTISISGAFAFNDLIVTHPTPVTGSLQRNLNFGTTATVVTLNLNGTNRLYSYTGNITIVGDLLVNGTNTNTPTGNTGVFTLSGAGPLGITGTAGAGRNRLGNVTINTTGSFGINSQVSVQGTWTSSNIGSYSAGTSTVHFGGSSATIASGTTTSTKSYFDHVNVLSGNTLGINNGSFVDIGGNFTQGGTFNSNTSLIQFTGALSHAVNGAATLTAFNAIEKSGSGSLSFSHATNILDSLKISGGSVNVSNITLKSTSSLKARLAEISGGSVSGSMNVETYIPGGTTDWAVLGASGVSGLTFNNWYGTIPMTIEGSATGVTSAGGYYFESVQGWNEGDAYGYDTTLTVSSSIATGKGYWLFVGTGLASTSAITTTVSGTPVSGNQAIGLSNSAQSGYCLIANPFASPISWDRIDAANPGATTGEIYIYNADLGVTTSYVGGVSTPGGAGSATTTIPMGQGFYVQALGGSLNIGENAKVAYNTGSDPLLKTNATVSNIGSVVRLNLTGGGYMDETAIRFHSNGTSGFDNGLDAKKYFDSPGYVGYPGVWNKRTTISTKSGNADYSINSLPLPLTVNAVIPVLVKVYASGQHTITGVDLNNLPAGTCVTLKDKLLNITHNLTSGPYVFTINDTTSVPRFELTVCANIVMGINNVTAPVSQNVFVKQDRNGVYVDLNFENSTKAYISANNILGQQLMAPKQVECTTGRYYLDLKAKEQIIMVNVITDEKRYTQKIFVEQN